MSMIDQPKSKKNFDWINLNLANTKHYRSGFNALMKNKLSNFIRQGLNVVVYPVECRREMQLIRDLSVLILLGLMVLKPEYVQCQYNLPGDSNKSSQEESPEWKVIARGVSVLKMPIFRPALIAPELTFVKVDLDHITIRAVKSAQIGKKRAFVNEIGEFMKAKVAINANFFDEDGAPLGLVISRGIQVNSMHRGGGTLTGIFALGKEQALISHRDSFSADNVFDAVQAGPRLIVHGKATKLTDSDLMSQRSGACLTTAGELVFFCSSSWPMGISFAQLQQMLLSNRIGCYEAINFDGGGSAQMYLSDGTYLKGTDPVPVALVGIEKVKQ